MSAHRVNLLLWSVAIAAAVLVGVNARMADPASSPVIPAEDPYTHMALVREHLRDGSIDPLNTPGSLYPPGLHAFLASAYTYTGFDLYDLVRFGPVAFGAIGILGLAVLLWRFDSKVAAFVGAVAIAVQPEAVFRTTMMSPTALDIALLPFLFYSLLELMRGRLAWLAAAVPLTLFLLFAHPWLFVIIGLTGLAFVLLTWAMPWRSRGAVFAPIGFAAALALVGTATALALVGCGGACGPGFRDVLSPADLANVWVLAPIVLVVALLPLGILRFAPRAFNWVGSPRRAAPPTWYRFVVSGILVGALALVSLPAFAKGLPEFVDPPGMFGWPVLAMAAVGVAILPFARSPGAHLAVAMGLATYPFVIHNPLDSPFWPHRTAVYLGLALAMLAGVAGGFLARVTCRAFEDPATGRSGAESETEAAHTLPKPTGARPMLVVLPALIVAVCLAGGVYAATPDKYDEGWYRLYSSCEMKGLREVSDTLNAQPEALVIAGSWQAKLVLASVTDDATRIWFKPEFFTDSMERDTTLRNLAKDGTPLVVLVDAHLPKETPGADTSFLDAPPYEPIGAWCGNTQPLRAYTAG